MSVSAISSVNLYPVLTVSNSQLFSNAIQNNGSGAGGAGQRPARAPVRQTSQAPAPQAAVSNEPKSTYLTLDSSSYANLTSWGWNSAAA